LRSKPKLTEKEKKAVEKAYDEAKKAIAPQSIKYSNEGMNNWFINNGFTRTEEGGVYVYKHKK
jgi:hypothetical protein